MTTRTDILQIKLETDGEGKVKASIAGVGKELEKTGKTAKTVASLLSPMRVAMLALSIPALKLAVAAVKTTAEFEKLNASLKTVTGSQVEASRAMDMIKALASDTPFSVQQRPRALSSSRPWASTRRRRR